MNETEYEVVDIKKMGDFIVSNSNVWNVAAPTTRWLSKFSRMCVKSHLRRLKVSRKTSESWIHR